MEEADWNLQVKRGGTERVLKLKLAGLMLDSFEVASFSLLSLVIRGLTSFSSFWVYCGRNIVGELWIWQFP